MGAVDVVDVVEVPTEPPAGVVSVLLAPHAERPAAVSTISAAVI
jgi:hypothetical protein